MAEVERLLTVVQELSLARDLERVMAIVRRAARELTGADGATFVLRDNGHCFYADEDAIEPLWKGQRFPMDACISGWAMLHREAVAIPDIYADSRVPHDAYRPTFVKSLVMVPIRRIDPVGAIGTYWREPHRASEEEIRALSMLADFTSIVLENERAQRHKDELAALLVHDLRSPANGIMLAAKVRLRAKDTPEPARHHWQNVHMAAETIHRMAMNLLDVTKGEDGTFAVRPSQLVVPELLSDVIELMTPLAQSREQRLVLRMALASPHAIWDVEIVRRVLLNLIDNALRYTPEEGTVTIDVRDHDRGVELRVIDQGPGVPEHQRRAIFNKYTRGGAALVRDDSAGRGLGLTFCRIAVERHGGTVEVVPGESGGSAFVVTLPRAS